MSGATALEEQYAQLRALEEFKQGEKFEKQGQFQQALPLYGRVHEIFASAASGNAGLAAASAYRLANIHRYLGQWKKASAVCQKFSASNPSTDLYFKTKFLNFSACCELLAGDSDTAVSLASQAIELAESQPAHEVETSVFVDGYSIRGVGLFYSGSSFGVDDLQNSTRLAPGTLDQLRGLNNLGAVHYLQSNGNSSEMKEAVAYWKDAVDGVTKGEAADKFLAELSTDVRLSEVYATILCNQAIATFPHSAREQVDEVSAAMDLLASALKTLEAHQENLQAHPAMGKILSYMAHGYHLMGQAVTAEGLFRSAFDKLETAFAAHDPRCLNDLASALNMQAELLKMWEKREAEGARATARATQIIGTLPQFASNHLLTSMIELPI